MIHSLEINDFRGFKDKKIILGKYITAISGRNGLGKSTILALLGNSCELKSKDGKTIFNTQYRTEFSEIFKASKEFDKSGANKCRINFSSIVRPNEITDTKICRVTWQKDRFRLIPETRNGSETNSRKKEWPSIYLGLSRLYPIGEASDSGMKIKGINLSEDEKNNFIKNYTNILNLDDNEEICVDMIDINETKRKTGVGITTSKYTSITNSAGQDNIGQILLAIISFSRLKEVNPNKYKGGLILIDEIDATLHPLAQIKLVNYLYSECKRLNLQVIFTTHSISLLEEVCMKTIYNKEEINNNYEVVYLTKSNGPLTIIRNPQFPVIRNDLRLPNVCSSLEKVSVYSEDAEARWLFNKLISEYTLYLNNINITMSCDHLLHLNKSDPTYFSNILFVLDGDVSEKDIKEQSKFNNIIKLPGKVRPEQVIYDFLMKLEPESQLWNHGYSIGFNKEYLKEHGPMSNTYKGKERDRYKKWFKDNQHIIESLKVFDFWKEENQKEYIDFLNLFKKSYNAIAERKFYSKIDY